VSTSAVSSEEGDERLQREMPLSSLPKTAAGGRRCTLEVSVCSHQLSKKFRNQLDDGLKLHT